MRASSACVRLRTCSSAAGTVWGMWIVQIGLTGGRVVMRVDTDDCSNPLSTKALSFLIGATKEVVTLSATRKPPALKLSLPMMEQLSLK